MYLNIFTEPDTQTFLSSPATEIFSLSHDNEIFSYIELCPFHYSTEDIATVENH